MKLILIVLSFVSLFPLLVSANAFMPVPKAFSNPDNSDCRKDSGVCEIKNLPRIASQDGLGICYACVAATMLQIENCRKLNLDCGSLESDKLISQVDIARFATPADQSKSPPMARSSYKGLKTDPDDNIPGSGGDPHSTALIAALLSKKVASESCVSLDKILSKMYSRNETFETQEALWNRMRGYYESYKKNETCSSCRSDISATAISEINKNLNLNISNEEVLAALGQESYEKFLDELTGANKCETEDMIAFESVKTVKYLQFPEAQDGNIKKLRTTVTDAEYIQKMRDILRSGRPAALSGICLSGNPQDCKGKNHAVVIAGHRKVCDRNPTDPKAVCRDSVRVINCWGKTWQNENNDGWVDAEALMKQTAKRPNILGWFEDKNK